VEDSSEKFPDPVRQKPFTGGPSSVGGDDRKNIWQGSNEWIENQINATKSYEEGNGRESGEREPREKKKDAYSGLALEP